MTTDDRTDRARMDPRAAVGRLGPRLAAIARDVQSRTDVTEATDEIIAAAMDLIDNATGAGITLVRGRHDVETAASTCDIVRTSDGLQHELGEGPCFELAPDNVQVYAGDLSQDDRWPTWAPRVAADAGIHSILCTQLFTHDNQLGALTVCSDQRYAFDADDQEVARLLAAYAAVAVASVREIEGLRVAVDRRTTIGKALGIVMAQYGLTDDQAMSVLRRLSSHQNQKLFEVAADVVRELALPAEGRQAPRP